MEYQKKPHYFTIPYPSSLPHSPVLAPISHRQGSTFSWVCRLGRKLKLPVGDLLLCPWPETRDQQPLTEDQWEGTSILLYLFHMTLPSAFVCGFEAIWETPWDSWRNSNNPIKVSDTLGWWHLGGEEVTTQGLFLVRSVFYWLSVPTGKMPTVRSTDKNQWPLLPPWGVFMRNWFLGWEGTRLRFSFPTSLAFRRA